MASGEWARGSGPEAGCDQESVLRGAFARSKPKEGTGKHGQGRRDARLEDLEPTVGFENEGFDGVCD